MTAGTRPIDLSLLDQAQRVKAKAVELGFDLVGISSAERSPRGDFFRDWIAQGRAGAMGYLANRVEERVDPATYMPGARSVICVAMNYHTEPPELPPAQTQARVARYARGDDYHVFLKDRLYDLADWLRDEWPGERTCCATDTAPVLERDLAARAGIGWIGKNTCVIHPTVGSWILLGEVLTTLPLATDSPISDHCGSCTRCLEACPTQALDSYVIDPLRCISYLTIESRGNVPQELSMKMGDWLFGCDICQEVCPWNRRAPLGEDPGVLPKVPATLDAEEVANWSQEQYSATLRHTAMKRVKLPQFQENARRVICNSKKSG